MKSSMKDTYKRALAPQSVTMTLEDDIDISRGDMLVGDVNGPKVGQDIEVMICWFNEKNLVPRGKYVIRHTSTEARCLIKEVNYKMNINVLEKEPEDKEVRMNDVARISIRTTKPLFYDSYNRNRTTGSLILIDEATNETVATGMIV